MRHSDTSSGTRATVRFEVQGEAMETYQDQHIHFAWPDNWELDRDEKNGRLTLTVSSPETSFWSVTLSYDRPDSHQVMTSVIDALRDEYDDLDVYPPREFSDGLEGIAQDLDFICMELVNSAFLRCFRTPRFTALVYYQGTDLELERTRPVLEAITSSLVFRDHTEL